MHGAEPLLALLLLLAAWAEVVVADRIIYPPLQNNDGMVMDPILVAQPYEVVPDQPISMNVVYDVPPQHHYHNEEYDGIVYRPAYDDHLRPSQREQVLSTQVDEYGRPMPPPAPRPIAPIAESHRDSPSEMHTDPHTHSDKRAADESGQPVYDDEPFLHRALDKVEGATDTSNAVEHDLGELNIKETGDDLTVHVGKNKVKTETVATITATITATDEHEDSYINVHRNAHEASAGHEHDRLDGRTVHLDGAKHDALDQQGGTELVPDETPPPDLSFLQDVEVLKVLFPWLEKHTGEQDSGQAAPRSLDGVV